MSTVANPVPGPSSPRTQPTHQRHALDTTSDFFQVLTAPYTAPTDVPPLHRAQPKPDHVARCRSAINWTSTPPQPTTLSSHPSPTSQPLDQPIYRPHGRWAWTDGLSIDNPRQLLPLRNGAQCSASIDSGTLGDREIKYICRRWKTSKQKEWYGFYSELALYKSKQYLRPLQGDVVPHIIGIHVMPEAVSMTMEMPHSSFWIESSSTMPDALKERVIAAFEKIHAQGVLHGDPELRHMLIGADGKVMIIDFGMSRAISEDASVSIERAEPEEFRLEMRKVKYKLDYKGARKKEGDKVDDYLRRVRRNKKISELWKRRAKGERVGPIPQYEEDPEEYELDPPVHAQDFQEDWITASDDTPMRVVVPGQMPREVASQVQALLSTLETACPTCSSDCPGPLSTQPLCDHPENVEDACLVHPPPLRLGSCHTSDENHTRSGRAQMARRLKRRQLRHASGPYSSPPKNEDEKLFPLSARHLEGASMRRGSIRHKHMKNTYISSLSTNPSAVTTFPSSIDVPEKPKSLQPDEVRRIEESRRQAMAQYSRAPKGILKRKRDEDDMAVASDPAGGEAGSPCKKLRFSEQVGRPTAKGRGPFLDSAVARRPRVMRSRAYKHMAAPNVRPELVDFTLPSLKTLSTLVGSLMPWVYFR